MEKYKEIETMNTKFVDPDCQKWIAWGTTKQGELLIFCDVGLQWIREK